MLLARQKLIHLSDQSEKQIDYNSTKSPKEKQGDLILGPIVLRRMCKRISVLCSLQ